MKYLFLVYVMIFIVIYLIEENIIHIDINYINYKIKNNMKYRLDNPKYTKFVDKLQFKEYCKSKGVDTIKTLKIYEQKDYDNINFNELPYKFILKSNKASGRNFIIKKNIKKKSLNGIVNKCPNSYIKLRNDISGWGDIYRLQEPQYEHTKPKIFSEELIEPNPINIRLYYLNYKLKLIIVYVNNIKVLYDENKNRLNIQGDMKEYNGKTVLDNMSNDKFKELISISDKLASDLDLDFFTVDIYYINNKFYGGEITLSPDRGNTKFNYI